MEFVLEPTDITRELILRKVSEENIMEHYLGVRVQKGLFKSPFRAEKQPSCCFYRSNKTGRLLFKDFGSDDLFDCVSVVMYKHSCSYYHALQIIANDFNIISKKRLIKNEPLIKYSNTKLEETGDAVIQVEIKDFDQHELNWWSKFGISAETLHKFKVFSCKNVFLNGNLFSLYKENQLIFGYYGGIREDIERWRIYFPSRKSYRFLSNWKGNMIQGTHMLPKSGEYLVITKSMKDCMVLYEFGIPSIAPCSETTFISDSQYRKLKERFDNIVILWDNDLTGIKFANKFRKQYDIIPLWLPRDTHKDISDYYKAEGKKKTLELIEKGKQCIREAKEKKES